jgi:hypothetical protein
MMMMLQQKPELLSFKENSKARERVSEFSSHHRSPWFALVARSLQVNDNASLLEIENRINLKNSLTAVCLYTVFLH